jgi:hypothetical protein
MAFFVLGMGLYAPNIAATDWVFNLATGLYAVASASGSLYFVLNFGTEGKDMVFDSKAHFVSDYVLQVARPLRLGRTELV